MNFMTSEPGAEVVEIEALYRATPAQVFRAWTDPELFARWFGRGSAPYEVDLDPRIGGAWRAVIFERADGRSMIEGVYTAVEPERLLAFTWRHVTEGAAGEREETPYSQVTVTLEAEGAATRMKVSHAGLREAPRRQVGAGWGESLEKLQKVVERLA